MEEIRMTLHKCPMTCFAIRYGDAFTIGKVREILSTYNVQEAKKRLVWFETYLMGLYG